MYTIEKKSHIYPSNVWYFVLKLDFNDESKITDTFSVIVAAIVWCLGHHNNLDQIALHQTMSKQDQAFSNSFCTSAFDTWRWVNM